MSKELLTPHRVALAIGVSESSLKRWCDRGAIPVVRTPGGHRRIPLHGVLEFLRSGQHQLVRPEVLGLPPATGKGQWVVERAAVLLRAALGACDEDRVRQLVFDVHLAGHPVSVLCDRVIAPAFHDLGNGWDSGAVEIYRERCACETVENALRELRDALPQPSDDGPLAIGGTPGGDIYRLPTRMAEVVLRARGWRSRSLGTNLPFSSLAEAIEQFRPRLFWLSVSSVNTDEAFLDGCSALCQVASSLGTAIVIGGRGVDDALRRRLPQAAIHDSMQHLEATALELVSPSGSA